MSDAAAMKPWRLTLRGGTFDRFEGYHHEPPPVLIAWSDGGEHRVTDDAANPRLVLATAVAYRRVAMSEQRRHAAYVVGARVVEPGVTACQDGPPEWAR